MRKEQLDGYLAIENDPEKLERYKRLLKSRQKHRKKQWKYDYSENQLDR